MGRQVAMIAMTPFELVLRFAAFFEGRSSTYFMTGSCAAMVYGEYRSTIDVDVVVDLRSSDALDVPATFPEPDYYVSQEAISQAIRHAGQFNIIHVSSGLKIDVMIPHDTPYTESRFVRATEKEIKPGRKVRVASPEDVILMKLKSFKEGGSDKHLRDIASMFKVSGETFDQRYLDRWARTLGVVEQLAVVRERLRTATDFK
jgi:hypothetical protein